MSHGYRGGGRWQKDAVDVVCESWAWQWVNQFGRNPRLSSETLGGVRSTLNLQRLATGDIRTSGSFMAHGTPEVFLGDGLVVACLMKQLTERQRDLLFFHYVDRWYILKPRNFSSDREPVYEPFKLQRPVKQEIVARRMGVSIGRYYEIRDAVKSRIARALSIVEDATPHPLNQNPMTAAG